MKHALAVALAIGTLIVSAGNALAEWSASAGAEHMSWRESTTPSVSETGVRGVLGLNWIQNKEAGWLASYHLKFYTGNVDYDGANLLTGVPVNGSTHYWGYTNEIQAIYRTPNNPLEFVGGFGWDSWQRHLSPQQDEDYDVYYLRVGVNVNTRTKRGFFGTAGIKYPIHVNENANLMEIGFDQNPRLHPKGEVAGSAELGYRFNANWDLIGYYDGWRFGQSNTAVVTANASFPGQSINVFQPQSKMDIYGVKLQYNF